MVEQIHMVIDHIEEYVESQGQGFSLFSEQTGEAVHSDYQKTWLHYQVKNVSATSYGENLLRATVAYNLHHI